MPFGVVSGVSRGTGVLDGIHAPEGEGAVSKAFCPISLNGVFLN